VRSNALPFCVPDPPVALRQRSAKRSRQGSERSGQGSACSCDRYGDHRSCRCSVRLRGSSPGRASRLSRSPDQRNCTG
jgi:hypothetical protein